MLMRATAVELKTEIRKGATSVVPLADRAIGSHQGRAQ
jgi:hypothetical protein